MLALSFGLEGDEMRRREFITLAGGAAVARPLAARAQIKANVQHVGILDANTAGGYTDQYYWRAFRDQMHTLGYVEGTNVEFDARWANGNPAAIPGLTSELLRLPVRVIVALSTPIAQAAKSVTSEAPIVVPLMADPVGVGLVASLARPGGNVTGLSTTSAELSAKRLELLREIVPNLSRAAIIWAERNAAFALTVRHTEIAAQSLGVALRVVGVRAARDFEKAVAELAEEQVQGVIVAVPAGGSLSNTDLAQLTAILAQQRLPAIYAEKEYVHAGGLMSYGPDYPDLFRRAATYTDRILKGMRPADLPVEQPTKFELAINRKTASSLGLDVPRNLLAIADDIVE
jgi:putative ABC transport system substrate-binding protein